MQIIDIRNYSGRNTYCHRPVVKMLVDLEDLTAVSSNEIAGFNEQLLHHFPGLNSHCCCTGREGGFVERLYEGTYFSHVVEHLALELQCLLGYEVYFGKTRVVKEPSLYAIIYEYCNDCSCLEFGRAAVEIISNLAHGRPVAIQDYVNRLGRMSRDSDLGPGTRAIWDEAKKRHIPVRRLGNDSLLQLGYGKYLRCIESSLLDTTSCIAVDVAQNKQLVKDILHEHNIPVPEGSTVDSEAALFRLAQQLGYPLTVKPYDGNHGHGITANINDPSQLHSAYLKAIRYSRQVIVEKHIAGKDYRLLVVGDRLVAAAERRPACVVGNGVHTVAELVAAENENPRRGVGHEKPLTRIRLDQTAEEILQRAGLTPESVPAEGEVVYLRENGNLSTGGTARDCTAEVHPANAAIAVRAAQLIGLDIAGIDLILSDIAQPLTTSNGAVIEVNACPGLRMHLYPTEGQPRNVAADILDYIYPKGAPYSIPVISVTGTNGKTTVTRLIRHVLAISGKKVGMACSSGTYIGEECISSGDHTGPLSAQAILYNREVEVAVLETARGGIIRRGLGYDLADVGVIVNISEDHLGLEGINTLEDMAFVKALVVEAIKPKGYAVLNADDSMTGYISSLVRCNLVYFSQNRSNPLIESHISQGGMAVVAESGQVMVYRNNTKYPILKLQEIPITFGGQVICNIENSLAAISSLIALGVPDNVVRLGLRSFRPDPVGNAGRFNLFDLGHFRILLDYAHNPSGYRSVMQFIKGLHARCLVGVIGMPGDRRDEAIFQAGQIAGQHFSRLYIKEDRDLRGRTPGEVAAILYNGAIRGGIAEAAIEIILPEVEALQTAIDRAVAGDLIVMFYEDFEQALAVVQGFAGNRLSSSPYEEDSLLRPDCVPFQAELDHANKPDYSEAYARL